MRFQNRKEFAVWLIVFLTLPGFAGIAFAGNPGYSDDHGTLAPYTQPELVSGVGKKLLAVYMVGSDLEWEPGKEGYNASADLDEMIKGYESLPNKESLDIVVAFGGCAQDGWKGMKIANISQLIQDSQDKRNVEDARKTVGIYGNSDAYLYKAEGAHMGDESSLLLFMDYLKDGYRSHEKKFLVFWDHGGAYAGCCNDTNFNSDGLNLTEIANGLKKNQAEMGLFDLIGFDQCLMASMEVAKVIKNYAKYMMGSEELEPGHGWNWTTVVTAYSGKDSVTEAATEMVDNFVQDVHFYKSDGKTLALLDLSRFDDLLSKIDPVASLFAQNLAAYSDGIIFGATQSQDFGKSQKADSRVSVDLIHFAENIKDKISDADTKVKLDEVIAAGKAFVIHAKNDGTRPNAKGVTIAPPESNSGDAMKYTVSENWLSFQNGYAGLKSGDTLRPEVQNVNPNATSGSFQWTASQTRKADNLPLFLKGERAGFVFQGTDARRSFSGNVKGMSATFSDDNLDSVTAIFGIESDNSFVAVAEVEAYPTSVPGEYFTPAWNKEWYTVRYDASADTEWMPLTFEERYEIEGKEYSLYSAEIDYYENGSDEPETAVLEIVADENNVVTEHSVRTYEMLYSGADDEEGEIRFDRVSKEIEIGDKIRFWTYSFPPDDPEKYEWLETGDIITFTQAPVFQKEVLEFEDEKGNVLKYKYAMWAEDINNNGRMTPLADVEQASEGTKDTGYKVTSDLWIKALIHTVEKGAVGAVWQKGGEDLTSRGDKVIWGYFYADPADVSWGSPQNPDLFVKIWFDISGRTDVNFFHVSVPDIEVASDYKYDGTPDQQGTATLSARYIRQWYESGKSYMEVSNEDGNPPAGYSPKGNPSAYSIVNNLKIGALINTVEKGPINGLWVQGGEAMTAGGHQAVWGHFYANPSDVTWGSKNNPDLFVKIWFDASGRTDVNFFHVSVPDIEVCSDFPADGVYNTQGTTILTNRYIRQVYQR